MFFFIKDLHTLTPQLSVTAHKAIPFKDLF